MTRFAQVGNAEVPAQFVDRLCRCPATPAFHEREIAPGVKWFVCVLCDKPKPLNAANARLYKECESCDEWYWVWKWPDKFEECRDCAGE